MQQRTKLALAGVGLFQVGQAFLMVNLAFLQRHWPDLYARVWPRLVDGAAVEVFVAEAVFSGIALGLFIRRRRRAASKEAAA